VRLPNARSSLIADVRSIAAGYHAVGASGESQGNITFRNCTSIGCAGGIPYVLFSNQNIANANHLAEDIVDISGPYYRHDGAPLERSAGNILGYSGRARLGYSHANPLLGGIIWQDCLLINPVQEITAKHSITFATEPIGGLIGARDLPSDFDQDDEATFTIKAIDCVGVGGGISPEVQVSHIGGSVNNFGFSTSTYSFFTAGGPWFHRLTDFSWTAANTVSAQISQISSGKGFLFYKNCAITLEGAGTAGLWQFVTPSQDPSTIILEGNTFTSETAGRALLSVSNPLGNDWATYNAIESRGGNTFGFNLAGVRNGSGTNTMSMADFVAEIDPNGQDTLLLPPTPPTGLAFTTVWKTDNVGTSNSNQIDLPLRPGFTYDFLVDWGDGTSNTIQSPTAPERLHTYSTPGRYTVSITGTFPCIWFNNGGDRQKLVNIDDWGTGAWLAMDNAFQGCSQLVSTPVGNNENFSAVTNYNFAFTNCSSLVSFGLVNFSAAISLSSAFRGLIGLLSFPAINLGNATNTLNTWRDSVNIENFSAVGLRVSFSLSGMQLNAAALNAVYANLATVTGQTITVTGNPGVGGHDTSIATAKGWTVAVV
jgi:hypothetical protein